MAFDDPAYDREAEACALLAARAHDARPAEWLEQLGQIRRRNTLAIILHGDGYAAVGTGHADLHVAATVGKFHRVADEIIQHLFDLAGVEEDQPGDVNRIERDADLLPAGDHAVQRHAASDELRNVGQLPVQLQQARLDRRDIQNVGNHLEHELAGLPDDGDELPLLTGQDAPGLGLQELAVAQDDAEWAAQIVRGHTEDAIFLLIQSFQFEIFLEHLALEVREFVVEAGEVVVELAVDVGRSGLDVPGGRRGRALRGHDVEPPVLRATRETHQLPPPRRAHRQVPVKGGVPVVERGEKVLRRYDRGGCHQLEERGAGRYGREQLQIIPHHAENRPVGGADEGDALGHAR